MTSVIVFLNESAVSQETLGYPGEFLGYRLPVGKTARARRSTARVLVPFLQRIVDVDEGNVIWLPEPAVPEPARIDPICAVRFTTSMNDDNDEIQGFFRVNKSDRWSHFRFMKTSRSHISYEYSASVNTFGLADGLLFFEVPRTHVLDQKFALQALTEIMGGGHEWKVAGAAP